MSPAITARIQAAKPLDRSHEAVLQDDALAFLAQLHSQFEPRRQQLLAARVQRQAALDRGARPGFDAETRDVREGTWQVRAPPADLRDRRVEITGPTDRKLMINALNSGAKVFMADFEDATVPTWRNLLDGQVNLMDAVCGRLHHETPDGRRYAVAPGAATLVVRPRGWHLPERHVQVAGESMSGSLFDFGLYAFHNARVLVQRGSAPYLYLPKLEHHLEARLWADVFRFTEEWLRLPQNCIRPSVLVETLPAAFQTQEILHELKERSVALNAGRWDYLFSVIKTYRNKAGFVLPDRNALHMGNTFLWAYSQSLVKACHARGAYAIGGMSAYVPDRRDPVRNQAAFDKVLEDKRREAREGFDGTWVAHPDLVPVAMQAFREALGPATNQLCVRPESRIGAAELLFMDVPTASCTRRGLKSNVRVTLAYLAHWLNGQGAVAIDNLMEDTATAEISRAQVWQWVRQGVVLGDGRTVTADEVRKVMAEEAQTLRGEAWFAPAAAARLDDARRLFERIALTPRLPDFLTLEAYPLLE